MLDHAGTACGEAAERFCSPGVLPKMGGHTAHAHRQPCMLAQVDQGNLAMTAHERGSAAMRDLPRLARKPREKSIFRRVMLGS